MDHPQGIRNVTVAGHLHHGKTSLMDMLVFETHQLTWDADEPVSLPWTPLAGPESLYLYPPQYSRFRPFLPFPSSYLSTQNQVRYTDTHTLSRSRGISVKSSPMSLILQDSRGKSFLTNLIDTPGHVNFVDEVASGMRLSDGLVLVVDVVEGVSSSSHSNVPFRAIIGCRCANQ